MRDDNTAMSPALQDLTWTPFPGAANTEALKTPALVLHSYPTVVLGGPESGSSSAGNVLWQTKDKAWFWPQSCAMALEKLDITWQPQSLQQKAVLDQNAAGELKDPAISVAIHLERKRCANCNNFGDVAEARALWNSGRPPIQRYLAQFHIILRNRSILIVDSSKLHHERCSTAASFFCPPVSLKEIENSPSRHLVKTGVLKPWRWKQKNVMGKICWVFIFWAIWDKVWPHLKHRRSTWPSSWNSHGDGVPPCSALRTWISTLLADFNSDAISSLERKKKHHVYLNSWKQYTECPFSFNSISLSCFEWRMTFWWNGNLKLI